MKKLLLLFTFIVTNCAILWAGIDMQAHIMSDEGQDSYELYKSRQVAYYTDNYSYDKLILQSGSTLFGSLNALIGETSRMGSSSLDYGTLRYAYVNVDKDLNETGKIIGFYNGATLSGNWNTGWNREHTWPQSKGANKNIPMGHDMQSVRPTSTSVNSSRGNDAFGESGSYYDPNEIAINNKNYNKKNNGTYRGDCARVILYDYITYGQNGSYKNKLYNGNAQLLSKLGASGLFESVEIMLKWHMQDPPSLTEMVRNDGAQDYQGNRNPMIDYPELAILILEDEVTTFAVSSSQPIVPNYTLTTKHGFVAYLVNEDGSHPNYVTVSGAKGEYEANLGRLTITNVTGKVHIKTEKTSATENVAETIQFYTAGNSLTVCNLNAASLRLFDLQGRLLVQYQDFTGETTIPLSQGIYVLQVNDRVEKVVIAK